MGSKRGFSSMFQITIGSSTKKGLAVLCGFVVLNRMRRCKPGVKEKKMPSMTSLNLPRIYAVNERMNEYFL